MSFEINADQTPPPTLSVQSAAAKLKLNRKVIEVAGVRGQTGRPQPFVISNVGSRAFTLDSNAFTIGGEDAEHFSIVGGSLPRRISVDKRAQFFVALTPGPDAPTNRVLTAYIDVTPSGETSPRARIALRGVATTGEGGDKEPSLARLMELFQLSINVGDTSPNTTFLDLNGGPTDEVFGQRFVRASDAPVTVTPIAQFVTKTATAAGRFGVYQPGLPHTRRQLFELAGVDGQSVSPPANGATTFNPGAEPFSVWAEATTFNDNGKARIVYGEDALNTWESDSSKLRKVRVYPLIERGKTIDNAYVVTFEEFPPQNDQNDYVFILRNVMTLRSRPVLGLVAVDGVEDATTLGFGRIEIENASIGNDVHDVSRVRIVNTGNQDLLIYSLSITGEDASAFQIVSPPSGTTTIARGRSLDVTVRFVATGGDLNQATLGIESNDKTRRVREIALNGFWQSQSEQTPQGVSQEPSLTEIIQTLGFRTAAVYPGETINTKGARTPVGDEVLSAYWKAADASKPIFARQVAGFHQQGTTSELGWYEQGKPFFFVSNPRYPGPELNGPRNTLFFNNTNYGQSFFQRRKDSSEMAQAWFKTNATFGFRVDQEFSDDELNARVDGDEGAHHMRFYPVRDSAGNFVADTYLMTMDFASINFDYNDNIFLISNIRPADRTAAVDGLAGTQQGRSVALDWTSVAGASGYLVQRAKRADGPFSTITSVPVTDSFFVDPSPSGGRSWFYRVIALAGDGKGSVPANTRVYVSV